VTATAGGRYRGEAGPASAGVFLWAPGAPRELLAAAAVALLAVGWFLRGVPLSGFQLAPGDRFDGRFNAYLLEHS
jgi:hypothetical protein